MHQTSRLTPLVTHVQRVKNSKNANVTLAYVRAGEFTGLSECPMTALTLVHLTVGASAVGFVLQTALLNAPNLEIDTLCDTIHEHFASARESFYGEIQFNSRGHNDIKEALVTQVRFGIGGPPCSTSLTYRVVYSTKYDAVIGFFSPMMNRLHVTQVSRSFIILIQIAHSRV